MTPDGALGAQILAICERLALAPDSRQLHALATYVKLLERWNATYNLTAVRDRLSILTQHLADCLALVPPLQRRHEGHCTLLDVGSGGGLPGVVVAVMLPGMAVTCVDAVAKKAAFVRQVAGTLRLPNLVAEHGRVEHTKGRVFDVITARAFGSLGDLVALTAPTLASDGVWLAMKGKMPTTEIAALPRTVEVFHVEQLQVPGLDAQRCLIWVRRTGEPEPSERRH